MKKYLKIESLDKKTLDFLQQQGINLESNRNSKVIEKTPVDKPNHDGIYQRINSKTFFLSIKDDMKDKYEKITVYPKKKIVKK